MVHVEFTAPGANETHDVALSSDAVDGLTGFSATGLYVAARDGTLKYARPGAEALTEAKMTKQDVAGIVYAGTGVTVTVVAGDDPLASPFPLWAIGAIAGGVALLFLILGLVVIFGPSSEKRYRRRIYPEYEYEAPVKRPLRSVSTVPEPSLAPVSAPASATQFGRAYRRH
jgi:hypothetical protein